MLKDYFNWDPATVILNSPAVSTFDILLASYSCFSFSTLRPATTGFHSATTILLYPVHLLLFLLLNSTFCCHWFPSSATTILLYPVHLLLFRLLIPAISPYSTMHRHLFFTILFYLCRLVAPTTGTHIYPTHKTHYQRDCRHRRNIQLPPPQTSARVVRSQSRVTHTYRQLAQHRHHLTRHTRSDTTRILHTQIH